MMYRRVSYVGIPFKLLRKTMITSVKIDSYFLISWGINTELISLMTLNIMLLT
jgi:hypothetical protein